MIEVDFPTVQIREGKVKVLIPNPKYYLREDGVYEPAWAPVFYNPRMVFNRDIAVLTLNTYAKSVSKGLHVADVLAGTGVRGIRFAVEVEGVERVTINDIDPKASTLARLNAKLNNVEDKVIVENYDANLLMRLYRFSGEFLDYVDVDPFGTPVPYLEAALGVVRRGGMIALTATDTATLSGVHRETCRRRYWANTFKVDFEKEMGLRVLMGYIVLRAATLDLSVNFKLSYYADHYFRVYFTVDRSARRANKMLRKLGYIRSPKGFAEELIMEVDNPMICMGNGVIGPLWVGELVDRDFVKSMLDALMSKYDYVEYRERARKLLELLFNEKDYPPYYYRVDRLCKYLKVSMPPLNLIIECLESRGYKASRTHFDNRSFKTNAPIEEVMECIKECAPP